MGSNSWLEPATTSGVERTSFGSFQALLQTWMLKKKAFVTPKLQMRSNNMQVYVMINSEQTL